MAKSPITSDDSVEIFLFLDWYSRATCIFEVSRLNASEKLSGDGFEAMYVLSPGLKGSNILPAIMRDPLVVLALTSNEKETHQASCQCTIGPKTVQLAVGN